MMWGEFDLDYDEKYAAKLASYASVIDHVR
jgi:hypothetical protein